jgi:rRNA maturation endonuclease Nob1
VKTCIGCKKEYGTDVIHKNENGFCKDCSNKYKKLTMKEKKANSHTNERRYNNGKEI